MAPETFSALNTAVQVRLIELPTVPIGLERERDTDVIKSLGTEGKQAQTCIVQVCKCWEAEYLFVQLFNNVHMYMLRADSQPPDGFEAGQLVSKPANRF